MLVAPVTDAGLNVPVTPAGAPSRVSATAATKVAVRVKVAVTVPLAPCLTVSAAGAVAIEKSGFTCTVTSRLASFFSLPLVATTLSVYF